ncbi:MAG: hypothetical protein WCX82_00920 [archaeon]|jgi:hypothetical protein
MITKNKGFLTLSVLLFVSLFLSIVLTNKKEPTSEFLQIKLINTKKQSTAINFEEFVKKELRSEITNPVALNKQINTKLTNYFYPVEFENWYILNTTTKEKIPINYLELNKITKVIILKPAPNVLIKRYTITNGITKNHFLSFDMETTSSRTHFTFPKNYTVEVIVYT